MKRLLTFGLSVALMMVLNDAIAQHDHDHEEDIHLGVHDGFAAVVEPEELAMPPYKMERLFEELIPGLYGVDQGWDFHMEGGTPQLRRVTVLQVFISDGLSGVLEGEAEALFGNGAPGVWTLEWDDSDPEAVHQHIVFASNTLPTEDNPLLFQFRLVDAVAWDGTALPDSNLTYTLEFVPEPASLLALSAGLGALALRRRRSLRS
ncbi:MAG: PEP-CTERM sorting domain-containing protein [Fimbriimonadales bacterium]